MWLGWGCLLAFPGLVFSPDARLQQIDIGDYCRKDNPWDVDRYCPATRLTWWFSRYCPATKQFRESLRIVFHVLQCTQGPCFLVLECGSVRGRVGSIPCGLGRVVVQAHWLSVRNFANNSTGVNWCECGCTPTVRTQ